MLILITSILIILSVIFYIIAYRTKDCDHRITFYILGGFSTVLSIGFIIAICISSCNIATSFTIDEQLTMYEEQNIQIETELDRLVTNYMKFESDTYKDLKIDESAITLINLFPELKSDELIKKQIDVYLNNNARIISLKNEKIEIGKLKWILYFGGV